MLRRCREESPVTRRESSTRRDPKVAREAAPEITLAIEDGANPTVIRDRITHTKPKRSAFDHYDRGPHWAETCRELAKLRLELLDPATALATADAMRSASLVSSGSEGGFRRLVGPVSAEVSAAVLVEGAVVRPRRYTTRGVASLLRQLVDVAEARDTEAAYVIAAEIRRREAKTG